MKTHTVSSATLKTILLYGLAYVLLCMNIVASLVALFQIHSAINVLYIALGGDRYMSSLISQVSILVGGLGILIFMVFLEGYYRQSITLQDKKPQLLQPAHLKIKLTDSGLAVLLWRFATTTAIPLVLLIVSLLTLEIALRILIR